jgi:hypothetical protein
MIRATMNDYLLFNAAVDVTGTMTAPFPMGLQNNAIAITLVIISGTTAIFRFARIVLKGPATNVCIVNLTANPYQA